MAELVLVASARMPHEAQMIKDRLEAEHISCLVTGATTVSCVGPINELNISWGHPLGGIRIYVPAEQEEAARASLGAVDNENSDQV
jgi:hypothetical protein